MKRFAMPTLRDVILRDARSHALDMARAAQTGASDALDVDRAIRTLGAYTARPADAGDAPAMPLAPLPASRSSNTLPADDAYYKVCFPAGTPVFTRSGWRPIEQIETGVRPFSMLPGAVPSIRHEFSFPTAPC